MRISKYFKISVLLALGGVTSCTKLNESYTSTIPADQAAQALGPGGVSLLLNAAYFDLKDPFISDQAKVFSLQENSTDESIVATRGGDWDDNGAWRSVHAQSWNADHVAVVSTFNALNKLNFDATNVLNFKPSEELAAEARFLRAFALFTLLDLYNKYPFRNPGDTLLNPPKVFEGPAAMQFIIDELEDILPKLGAGNSVAQANPDACKVLLMRCYLNRGAFNNRTAPTFDAADLQKVIDLGNSIISSAKYGYESKYFKNFNPSNGSSTELIWGFSSSSGLAQNLNPRMDTRWSMTFHYNEWVGNKGSSGWNGFSTTSDFYQTFGQVNGAAATVAGPADTLLDTRLGGRRLSDSFCTAVSGIRPGFLVGQQFAADGTPLKDRNNNPLAFTAGGIPDNMFITGPDIEVAGIRVAKYVPDFTGNPVGVNYATPGNWMAWMRYSEVKLMVAEALLRQTPNSPEAIVIVNELRAARGAKLIGATLPLQGTTVKDPNTFLAERGRELYWESFRRTDLIRFGMFLTPWTAKTNTSATYIVFPIPNQALAVNPNLTQNPGYTQ